MTDKKVTQSEIYRSLALKSPQIIKNFKFVWGAIIGFLIIGGYFIVGGGPLGDIFRFTVGPWLGRITLVLLGIVVFPGILGRLQIEIPITRVITLFRRQLGITVFLLGLTHYEFIRGIPSGILRVLTPSGMETNGWHCGIFARTMVGLIPMSIWEASSKISAAISMKEKKLWLNLKMENNS